MTPLNILVMLAIPLALLGVLAIVLISGRLSPQTRLKVELGLATVFYPATILFFAWVAWQSWDPTSRLSWMMAAITAAFAVMIGLQGLSIVRKLRQRDDTTA
ncbi:hypothetical protein ACETK8_17580 [Brevundimonas staleyi]|uniref:Uncharacterized protein n=1 Tax=Brevundimonas staleyi TaxID=74326 RepID=A0ABW0FSD2_9CAUL